MKKKYTTQDIANMLGISRTTVSKALNNHPSVPEDTRAKIKEAAIGLGYKRFKDKLERDPSRHLPPLQREEPKMIAFMVNSNIDLFREGFWGDVLRGVEESTRKHGFNMAFNFITAEDLIHLRIPQTLDGASVRGIILAGMSNPAYIQAVADLGLPTVCIDSYADLKTTKLPCDLVMMESEQSVYELTSHLIECGHERLGFIGDIHRYRSFAERWFGFRRALQDAELTVHPKYCLTRSMPHQYFDIDEIASTLSELGEWPTAFVCANDLIALQLIKHLETIGIKVPEDVSVAGFDLMNQNKHFEGTSVNLTTVQVVEAHIGARAFEQLLWRMEHKDRPTEHVRIHTKVLIGDTTRVI